MVSGRAVAAIAILVSALAAGACTSPGSASPSPDVSPTAARAHRGEVHVTIFHGTHFDGAWELAGGQDFARRAALLRRLRAALPEPGNALVVGNGDDIDPGIGRGRTVGYRFIVDPGPDVGGV